MTINYSYGNDIIVTTSSETYRGLNGDDIYIISKGLVPNSDINIIDTSGKNIIQFVDTINIIETKISNDALQITLTNNSKITINEANSFQFELSGNITSGKKGSLYNFDELVALIAEGISINEDIVSINKKIIVSVKKNYFSKLLVKLKLYLSNFKKNQIKLIL